jgi:hypothetical protein
MAPHASLEGNQAAEGQRRAKLRRDACFQVATRPKKRFESQMEVPDPDHAGGRFAALSAAREGPARADRLRAQLSLDPQRLLHGPIEARDAREILGVLASTVDLELAILAHAGDTTTADRAGEASSVV